MTSHPLQLHFLGAANTVTGSRFLLDTGKQRILIDCGMFQGYKNLRERNWRPFPVPAKSIDAIVLTHAHMDHSGFVPALVREGFAGKVYCTDATAALCEILWMDAAHLQTEEAEYLNRHHISKHQPARPLYDEDDARSALRRLKSVTLEQPLQLGDIQIRFHRNGHILGSAFLEVVVADKTLLFSGDLGRPHDAVMRPPLAPVYADYLIVESTYGDRLHDKADPLKKIADIINETIHLGGSILMPAFAVGRAQHVLYMLAKLQEQNAIPNIPVYLDSPMATSVTDIYRSFTQYHKLHGE
jgi:metallo-beta-lactamase family protein